MPYWRHSHLNIPGRGVKGTNAKTATSDPDPDRQLAFTTGSLRNWRLASMQKCADGPYCFVLSVLHVYTQYIAAARAQCSFAATHLVRAADHLGVPRCKGVGRSSERGEKASRVERATATGTVLWYTFITHLGPRIPISLVMWVRYQGKHHVHRFRPWMKRMVGGDYQD